ncbi:hypothetical protein PVAP13_3KG273827 [Panicum virgatum]|nr:hypothetical protein PVAP13_3KG273827 [Panicum virgatum]KAG2628347.1 hypothetical protein PVAP13_3KG273827 [Panicum virgatum]
METAFRSVRKVCAPAMAAPPATLPSPPPTISSRSSSSTRHPRPPLRRCRPPGLGGGLMPRSHLPPTPNPRRGPVMLTRRMRKTRSCASGSAWRPSTESGPGSSPPSMRSSGASTSSCSTRCCSGRRNHSLRSR